MMLTAKSLSWGTTLDASAYPGAMLPTDIWMEVIGHLDARALVHLAQSGRAAYTDPAVASALAERADRAARRELGRHAWDGALAPDEGPAAGLRRRRAQLTDSLGGGRCHATPLGRTSLLAPQRVVRLSGGTVLAWTRLGLVELDRDGRPAAPRLSRDGVASPAACHFLPAGRVTALGGLGCGAFALEEVGSANGGGLRTHIHVLGTATGPALPPRRLPPGQRVHGAVGLGGTATVALCREGPAGAPPSIGIYDGCAGSLTACLSDLPDVAALAAGRRADDAPADLAAVARDGRLRIWGPRGGAPVLACQIPVAAAAGERPVALTFLDGSRLACLTSDDRLAVGWPGRGGWGLWLGASPADAAARGPTLWLQRGDARRLCAAVYAEPAGEGWAMWSLLEQRRCDDGRVLAAGGARPAKILHLSQPAVARSMPRATET